ncbi:MAG: protein translocase subunit SecF [Patescibacteria group bacterium]
MLHVVKYYKILFIFSGILIAGSLAALIFWGLNFGIDFRGGSLMEIQFNAPQDTQALTTALSAAGYGTALVQPSQDNKVFIKIPSANSEEDHVAIQNLIKMDFGDFDELRFDSVGPVVGEELRQKAYWQTGLVILGILLYIAYAFRKVGVKRVDRKVTPWRMSLAAVVALIHDLIITLGAFAVLGRIWHVEIDALFVTALLTILGFSVHDTIVVFDRVRENMQVEHGLPFSEILNYSVNQTLTRSINTSITVLFVLLALALFGGSTIFYFVVALILGITVGTYSSIYVASSLLLVWSRE